MPESRDEAAPELPEDFVSRVFRFPVDQLQKHAALGAGHVLQHGRVLLFDRCGDAFDVLFLFLFRFEPEQFRLHLNHLCFGGLGYGIDFLHRFDQFAVTAQVSFFAEYEDGFYGDDRDRVAVGSDFERGVPSARLSVSGRSLPGQGEQQYQG